jgi:hypothetical protein
MEEEDEDRYGRYLHYYRNGKGYDDPEDDDEEEEDEDDGGKAEEQFICLLVGKSRHSLYCSYANALNSVVITQDKAALERRL